MKMRISNERGSVLLGALVILGLLALTLMATLNMVSTQRNIVNRTQKWNLAIPMCEAGVEDAMAHLNYTGTTNLGSDGWALTTNGTYFRSNSLTSAGFYSTTISTASPPVIISQGYVLDPSKSNYLTRTVQVNTRQNGQFPDGILSKGSIVLSGGAKVDSFNSTDTTYSTGGVYDPTKSEANAKVYSTGTTAGIIAVGTSKIYGSVDTGPGGTATVAGGAVGDAAWDASNSGIETGHSAADVNTIVPDVTLPSMAGALTPTSGAAGGTNYTYALRGGNYTMNTDPSIGGGKAIVVTAPSTLYVNNTFTVSGSGFIYIAPGASLQLYVTGPKCDITGGGVVNGALTAPNCQIWCMPTCTEVTTSGSSGYIGTIYAPEAAITVSGSAATSGAMVGGSFVISGSGTIHYDEALGGPGGYKFLAASWQEL